MDMDKRPIAIAELNLQPFTTFNPDGVLLVSGSDVSHANPMTISWGMFGIMWGKPTMMAMVRHTRYTYNYITKNPDFTVNWMSEDWSDALRICGSTSGRDMDKFAETGLTPVPGIIVASPVIDQSALSLECRTIYRTELTQESFLDQSVFSTMYGDGDIHDLFFGEIVAASGVEAFHCA
ncbi:MAG TPA: flavin reductase family protein [Armatimonadota bacterium]|nr:flavin reductase family protein [Armatimonadota bacterium]